MNYKNIKSLLVIIISLFFIVNDVKTQNLNLQNTNQSSKDIKWYDRFSIRGYVQVRYNRLFETNDQLGCEQCDNSWGEGGGFFIRRTRIIFFGQISKQVYFYIQPDFASSAGSDRLHYGQLRDAYFDIGLDEDNEYRFRVGQSKVPFGFENMQSSQNRLALDRNDALNSALRNERDLGVFFYWAPKKKRELFRSLVASGLKGSGDYGVFGLGAYNGQTANNPELNDNLHVVARLTWPFEIKNQVVEASLQGYTGQFVLSKSNLSNGVKYKSDLNYLDRRVAATFVLYPKPFGIQAEYNIGQGPEFNKITDSIEVKNLTGGYIQCMYNVPLKKQFLMPFIKYQVYNGGKKHERDARSYIVKDLEIGFEWQPVKQFELVGMYTISNRRYEDFGLQDNHQTGNLLRLQAQINF
ncbi:MAG: hypothetical protein KGZ59_07395 [Chitinophagaceae bacterium]|nr:hypothetical protein [Chitinophagaceae bacterium]